MKRIMIRDCSKRNYYLPSMNNSVELNTTYVGADPTGTTDSYASIQEALNSLTPTGGTLCLPSGTFKVSQSLVIPAGVSLIGQGSGISSVYPSVTRIKAGGGGFPVLTILGTPTSSICAISVERLVIYGGGNSVSGSDGIYQEWANYTTVRDVRIHGCYKALHVNNVYAINIWGVNVDGGGSDASSYGLYMDCHDQLIGNNAVNCLGCYFQGNLICGIRGETFSGSKFVNCEITLAGQYGIYFGDPSVAGVLCQFSHICNVLVDGCATQGYLFSKGTASRLGSIAMTGCWCGNNHLVGINVQGGECISITGGIVQECQNGVVFNGCNNCVISGVTIFQFDDTASGAGGLTFSN